MKCHIINQTDENKFKEYYPLIRKYFNKTFKVLELKGKYEISLILVNPEMIQQINKDYRKINRETDVISFAEIDGDNMDYQDESDVIYLGDIFINTKRVESQAREYEHSEKREFVFLFIHGLLHTLGYDHIDIEDEKKMIEKQKLIIGELE